MSDTPMSWMNWQSRRETLTLIEHSALFTRALYEAADRMVETLHRGGVVLTAGNGGSAAEAQHLAGEILGRFKKERRGYAAIALSTDTSALTAIGNDYGFDSVYSRQLEALAKPGDLFIAFSTSGASPNVILAAEAARRKGIRSIALTGRGGGTLAGLVDIPLIVPSNDTALIQEVHLMIIHMLCERLDEAEGKE